MSSLRRAALAVAGAMLAGCSGAPVPTASPPDGTAGSTSAPIGQLATPTVTAGAPLATPETTAAPTLEPTAVPTPTPRPEPSMELLIDGHEFWDSPNDILNIGPASELELTLRTHDLDRSACRITYRIVPDAPDGVESTKSLPPLKTQTLPAHDETHYFTATCPSIDGRLTAKAAALVADGQPERCLGFDAPSGAITATTVEELTNGMVGRWGGCADTPWTPRYWVDMAFRADGTYTAITDEVLDLVEMRAMYYEIDPNDPGNRWLVTDVVDGVGSGDIHLASNGNVSVDELGDVRLMGDVLFFEVFNPGTSGPRTYRLLRE